VNFPIDTPVSGVNMEDRPLLNKLLEVDEYRARYHDYLWEITEGYFGSGKFENTIAELDARINQYVKNDVSALFTYEQYEASLPVLAELGRLRAQSIRGQLEGTIPSTSSGQNADRSSLIDASNINLSALGSMMGGGMRPGDWEDGQGGRWDGREDMPGGAGDRQDGQGGGWPGGQGGMPGGGMFDMDMGLMRQAMQIIMDAGGELTDEVRAALREIGLTDEQIDTFSGMQNRFFGGGNMQRGGGGPQGGNPQGGDQQGGDQQGGNAQVGNPQGVNPQGGNSQGVNPQGGGTVEHTLIIGALVIALAGAIIFVAWPKKNVI